MEEAVEYSRCFMQIHLDPWAGFEGACVIRQVFGPGTGRDEHEIPVLILVDETDDAGAPPDSLLPR